MDVRPVDPRDIESEWDAHRVVYRVYFWSDRRSRSDEYEITGASGVADVLAWVEAERRGREHEVMIVDRSTATAFFLVGPLDHTVSPDEVVRSG